MSSLLARSLRGAARGIRRAVQVARFRRLHAKYAGFTLVGRRAYVENLFLAKRVADVAGCVVECGVWRGGMIAGIAEVLGPSRAYVLFDSFEGLPPPREVDGPAALAWQSGVPTHGNLRTEPAFAAEAMGMSGARDVRIVPGWFAETLPAFRPPAPIALLRLDGDWFDSTLACLEHLYRHVAPGGLVVVDDYFTWDGCSRAVHRFLSDNDLPSRVRESPGGVCFLVPAESPQRSD